MLELSRDQKEAITRFKSGIIISNNQKYYYKPSPKHLDGLELVVEDLASLVDIKCAHYERIVVDNTPYVVSTDIAGDKTFKTAAQLLSNYFKDNNVTGSLYVIWHFLEEKYPQDIKYIMNELLKIYIFDIIILGSDRSFGNWGLLFDSGRVTDVYILDNEYSFDNEISVVLDARLDIINDKTLDAISQNMKNLEYFFNTSSSEFMNIFYNMYNTLNPDTVKSCFENVEDDIGDNFRFNRELFYNYLQNYDAIGKLLNKRGLR